jgi:hypothetical protein
MVTVDHSRKSVRPAMSFSRTALPSRRASLTATFRDPAERRASRCGPPGDRDGHHLAGHRPPCLAFRHLHVHDEATVEGHDKPQARRVGVVATDDPLGAPFENPDDAPLGSIARPAVLHAHDNPVAVHGLIEVVAGNVDARRAVPDWRFRVDEGETAGIRRHTPDDQIHPVRQSVAVAAYLDQRAGGDQCPQAPPERCPLLARHAQPLHEFLGRGRVIDTCPDPIENLFV